MGISLTDRNPVGDFIGYTDCMESSVLRFVQAMLADTRSLTPAGVPTCVDPKLVRTRVRDPEIAAFFAKYPDILDADDYFDGVGYEARQDWARLMTRKPFFSNKRSTTGIYKNDVLTGRRQVSAQAEWLLELEPCVANVISVLRHFLGVDFAEVEREPTPWAGFGEAHTMDVSAAAQPYFDVAMRQLSRPEMELTCTVCPAERRFAGHFCVAIEFDVNREPTWHWELQRHFLDVVAPFDAGCAHDQRGRPILTTSAHSVIEDLRYGIGSLSVNIY
jgi:hypothetical protein